MMYPTRILWYVSSHGIVTLIVETLFNLKLQGLFDQQDIPYLHDDFILKLKHEWKVFSDSYEGTLLFHVFLQHSTKNCDDWRCYVYASIKTTATPNKGSYAADVLASFYYIKFIDFLERYGHEMWKLQGEIKNLDSAVKIIVAERNLAGSQD